MVAAAGLTRRPEAAETPVGVLLREWRTARRMSQLHLALDAGISARHLSYVETGKSRPSHDMLMRLADTLEMPLRERNALLTAAGYSPRFPETGLTTPGFAKVRQAIALTLRHHEPYPAFVVNRHLDLVVANDAAPRLFTYLRGGAKHGNIIQQVFDPNDMRPAIANWEEVARDLLRHLQDRVSAIPSDTRARALLQEATSYPGVPAEWRARELETAPSPLLTVVFRKESEQLRFFSTIATFGSPRDVTLDELRIECMFPADDATAERCRALATQ